MGQHFDFQTLEKRLYLYGCTWTVWPYAAIAQCGPWAVCCSCAVRHLGCTCTAELDGVALCCSSAVRHLGCTCTCTAVRGRCGLMLQMRSAALGLCLYGCTWTVWPYAAVGQGGPRKVFELVREWACSCLQHGPG